MAILGISKHESKFQKEEIDYEAFLELTEDDLKEMSLPIGVIIKIQKFQKEQNDMVFNFLKSLAFYFHNYNFENKR